MAAGGRSYPAVPTGTRPRNRGVSDRWRALPREMAIVAAAVAVYFGVRGETVANPAPAYRHASELAELEQRLGIDIEHSVQRPFLGSDLATDVMNWVYIWGHWPVIIAVLAWLFLRHPQAYGLTRAAMMLSGAVGLVVFMTYPVAPPRLADPELVDTVTEFSTAYRVLQPPAFTNPYAAMPSLHVGWDLLIGIAVVVNARWLWLKVVGTLLPAVMLVAVVATANHYVLDAVAGVALVLVCLLAVTRVTRRGVRVAPVVAVPTPREPDAGSQTSSPGRPAARSGPAGTLPL